MIDTSLAVSNLEPANRKATMAGTWEWTERRLAACTQQMWVRGCFRDSISPISNLGDFFLYIFHFHFLVKLKNASYPAKYIVKPPSTYVL